MAAWEDVLEYVTYYIPMIVFPRFKRDRGSQYFEFLCGYADHIGDGAQKSIDIWNSIAFFSQSEEEAANDFQLTNQIRQEIIEEEQESERGTKVSTVRDERVDFTLPEDEIKEELKEGQEPSLAFEGEESSTEV